MNTVKIIIIVEKIDTDSVVVGAFKDDFTHDTHKHTILQR